MNPPTNESSQLSCCEGGTEKTIRTVQPEYRSVKTETGLALHLALPGVPRDGATVAVEGDLLTVRAERPQSIPEGWTARRERPLPDAYLLRVRLRDELDPASIRARLEHGVLTLEIERHAAAQPRQIEVN